MVMILGSSTREFTYSIPIGNDKIVGFKELTARGQIKYVKWPINIRIQCTTSLFPGIYIKLNRNRYIFAKL